MTVPVAVLTPNSAGPSASKVGHVFLGFHWVLYNLGRLDDVIQNTRQDLRQSPSNWVLTPFSLNQADSKILRVFIMRFIYLTRYLNKPDEANENIIFRDHFVIASSQWETMLHRKVLSHWLGTYTKWFRPFNDNIEFDDLRLNYKISKEYSYSSFCAFNLVLVLTDFTPILQCYFTCTIIAQY